MAKAKDCVRSPIMDEEELQQWILRRLGAPMVKVELTCEQIDDSIQTAKDWFIANKGVYKILIFDVVQGNSEYCLPQEVEKVTAVSFSVNGSFSAEQIASLGFGAGFGPVDIFGGLVVGGPGVQLSAYSVTWAWGGVGGPLSAFTQALQSWKELATVFSGEVDWRQDGRILRLFPVRGFPTGPIFVEYRASTLNFAHLESRDHEMVKNYSLAMAMQVLGRIRSKYSSFPTAQGSSELDGNALLDESRQMVEKLEAFIYESAFPMGFMIG